MTKPKSTVTSLINFAFLRPDCTPRGGFVLAEDWCTAIKLVNFAYGYTKTMVFDGETTYDEHGAMTDDEEEDDLGESRA